MSCKPSSPSRRYLTAEDIAEELGCSRSKAYEIAKTIRGENGVTREAFENWIVAHTITPPGSDFTISLPSGTTPPPYTGPELVYFIQSGEGGPVKIGRTRNVKERIGRLQIGNPIRLELMATMPGGPRQESSLHHRFRAHAVGGEWFQPTPELLTTIDAARQGAR